jgi:hypothetical protein
MINEENMEYYTEEGSSLNGGSDSQGSGELDFEEDGEDDFCKYRKE